MMRTRVQNLPVVLVVALVATGVVFAGGIIARVSVGAEGAQANGDRLSPTLPGGGQFVTAVSNATNIVPTNGAVHVFACSLNTGPPKRVSGNAAIEQANLTTSGYRDLRRPLARVSGERGYA
jgi:hypothetical protein